MGKYANEILNLINSSDNHMTAEQVFFELKKSQPKIVLASVYNNLNRLSEQGSIRKICMDGEADRYDKTTGTTTLFAGVAVGLRISGFKTLQHCLKSNCARTL